MATPFNAPIPFNASINFNGETAEVVELTQGWVVAGKVFTNLPTVATYQGQTQTLIYQLKTTGET